MNKHITGLFRIFLIFIVLFLTSCDDDSSDSNSSSVSYYIKNVSWSDFVDDDSDGYTSYRKLNFNIDVNSGTKSVFVVISYKFITESAYSVYFTSTAFSITGTDTSDAKWVAFGSPNPELDYGLYDFKIEVYEEGGTTAKATLSSNTSEELNDEKFEPQTVTTYSVFDAAWYDAIDNDSDGYTSFRKLAFDVDVVSGTKSVFAKIYSKLSTETNYSLYMTTTSFTITDDNTDDAVWVAVGSPNADLDYGYYDFKIEIYETGGTIIVASRSADNDSDLENQKFETEPPLTYSVYDAGWMEPVDGDSDGYTSFRKLAFDVDVVSGTKSVFAKIYCKLYTETNYSLYLTTTSFTITDNTSADAIWVAVGSPNADLVYGFYDFKIEIYETGGTTLQASRSQLEDVDLDNQKFETEPPLTYSVYDAGWMEPVDGDSDGYTSFRKLAFDVDVVSGTKSVFAKIYCKLSTETYYSLYLTTTSFTITDNTSADAVWVAVGSPNADLVYGLYDFKIEIYETGGTTLQASRSPSDDIDLDNQKFETEPVTTYSVKGAWWYDVKDIDGDGYSSLRKIAFDADVVSGTHSVYAKLYYKASSATSYTLYSTTSPFSITDSNTDDAIGIIFGPPYIELSYGTYDFFIEIYEEGGTTVKASRSQLDDVDLDNQKFETEPVTYTVYNAWWTDAVDNDSDGYTAYRKLNMDVDVVSGTRNIFAKIYYKLSTATYYTLYYTTPLYAVTDSYSTDSFWVAIGSPNPQLPYGTYDFFIEIYDGLHPTVLVATLTPATDSDLNDENFESTVKE